MKSHAFFKNQFIVTSNVVERLQEQLFIVVRYITEVLMFFF